MQSFRAELQIIDGNPFVSVPHDVLANILDQAGRDTPPVPIEGTINERPFTQTLMKFRGAWRLYVNMQMLNDSPRRIGETIDVEVTYDPSDRTIEPHPKLIAAFKQYPEEREAFDALSPSRQKEILRYIGSLKTDAAVDRNVERAIGFLAGQNRFVGRDKP